MTREEDEVFGHAWRTAGSWLDAVTAELGTADRLAGHRALRAWLHALRDRLPVGVSADFTAGLPELFRGMYYEGWRPSHVPVKYGAEEFRRRFAVEACVAEADVDVTARSVTRALRRRLASGQLDRVMLHLPGALLSSIDDQAAQTGASGHDAWLRQIEGQVAMLETTVTALADGLRHPPVGAAVETR